MTSLVSCHICLVTLTKHPYYSLDVARTCTTHGDYFLQKLNGEKPRVVFRPFTKSKYEKPNPFSSRPGVRVRCDQTGKIYPSLKAAGADMRLDKDVISEHLAGKYKQVKGYSFTRLEEGVPVPRFQRKPMLRAGGGRDRVKIRCNQTGVEFASTRQASEEMGLTRSVLMRHLKDPEKYHDVKGFTFTKI